MFLIKKGLNLTDFLSLTPKMFVAWAVLLDVCSEVEVPVTITSLISDRDNLVTKSSTHASGRAIDISVKEWTLEEIGEVVKRVTNNSIMKEIGAISASDGVIRSIVYHGDKNSMHLHLQVRP